MQRQLDCPETYSPSIQQDMACYAKYKNYGNAVFYRITEEDVETLDSKRYEKDND